MKAAVWIGLGLVVLVGGVGWRMSTKQGDEAKLAGGGKGKRTQTVEVVNAASATIVSKLEAVGSLESPTVVELAPQSTGRITFVQVREGDAVKAGQVLVRIDPAEAQSAVLSAKANVAAAKARLAQAELQQAPNSASVSGQVATTQADLTTAQAQLEQAKKSGQAQVSAAESQVTSAKAQVASAKANIANAQAVLDREQANLTNAQANYDRVLNLYKQNFTAAQDVDNAKTARDAQAGTVGVAKAALEKSKSDYDSALAQQQVATKNLAVAESSASAGVVSAQAKVDQAKSALSVSKVNLAQDPAYKENLAALRAAVSAAEGQLGQAESALAQTTLSSPVDGTVTMRNGNQGSLASPGQPVVEVQELDWLYFRASLPIEASGSVKAGDAVRLTVDGLDGKTFSAKITNISQAADPTSRRFVVLARVENKDHGLKPGMFGRLSAVSRSVDAAVAVPKEALTTNAKGTTVAVVDDKGKVSVRPVQIGATDGDLVQVLSGVSAGEQVVTVSSGPLKDGQTVALPKVDSSGKGGADKGGSGTEAGAKA